MVWLCVVLIIIVIVVLLCVVLILLIVVFVCWLSFETLLLRGVCVGSVVCFLMSNVFCWLV